MHILLCNVLRLHRRCHLPVRQSRVCAPFNVLSRTEGADLSVFSRGIEHHLVKKKAIA